MFNKNWTHVKSGKYISADWYWQARLNDRITESEFAILEVIWTVTDGSKPFFGSSKFLADAIHSKSEKYVRQLISNLIQSGFLRRWYEGRVRFLEINPVDCDGNPDPIPVETPLEDREKVWPSWKTGRVREVRTKRRYYDSVSQIRELSSDPKSDNNGRSDDGSMPAVSGYIKEDIKDVKKAGEAEDAARRHHSAPQGGDFDFGGDDLGHTTSVECSPGLVTSLKEQDHALPRAASRPPEGRSPRPPKETSPKGGWTYKGPIPARNRPSWNSQKIGNTTSRHEGTVHQVRLNFKTKNSVPEGSRRVDSYNGRHPENPMNALFSPVASEQDREPSCVVNEEDRKLQKRIEEHARKRGWQIYGRKRDKAEAIAIFRRALVKLGIPATRPEEVWQWYEDHYQARNTSSGKRWLPEITNGRQFGNLWQWINRRMDEEISTRVTITPEAIKIANRLAGSTWPKNSADQLPSVVQKSIDAVKEFHKRLGSLPEKYRRIAQVVASHLGGYDHAVPVWLEKVRQRVRNWADWSGDLAMFVWSPTQKDVARDITQRVTSWGALGTWQEASRLVEENFPCK